MSQDTGRIPVIRCSFVGVRNRGQHRTSIVQLLNAMVPLRSEQFAAAFCLTARKTGYIREPCTRQSCTHVRRSRVAEGLGTGVAQVEIRVPQANEATSLYVTACVVDVACVLSYAAAKILTRPS